MKLESLNSSKFDGFTMHKIENAHNTYGGKLYLTSKMRETNYSDCWDDSCGKDVKTTDLSGTSADAYDKCPAVAPSTRVTDDVYGSPIDLNDILVY
jgi:hypothetical protein